jgi:hypothetical protein
VFVSLFLKICVCVRRRKEGGGGMAGIVKHIVMLKFKAEVTEEEQRELIAKYAALTTTISAMKTFEWCVNLYHLLYLASASFSFLVFLLTLSLSLSFSTSLLISVPSLNHVGVCSKILSETLMRSGDEGR